MPTVNAPKSFNEVQASWGYDFVFAGEEMLLELQDSLDVESLGIVPLIGDVAGTGSDTLRVRSVGSVGWSGSFTELANETDVTPASSIVAGYREVTVGMHGMAHEETYLDQILNGRRNWVSLNDLKAMVPMAWKALFRSKLASVQAGFATAVGSATTRWSVDDVLDLLAAARAADYYGELNGMVAPQQFDQLLRSARTEPAFQASADAFKSVAGVMDRVIKNYLGLGLNMGLSNDVTQSGGAYQGAFWSPGGVGWAVGSTAELEVANPAGAIYIPEFGLVIEEELTKAGQRTRRYSATTILGMAQDGTSGPTTSFKRRLISVV